MNKVILIGRLTKDPEVRYTTGENQMAIANYTLAVDRRMARREANEQTADFINCVAFGKSAEFAQRYMHKGTKMAVSGRIQTRNFTNRDGQKVYVTEVVIDDQEFAESKGAQSSYESGYRGYEAPRGNADFAGMDQGMDELPFA